MYQNTRKVHLAARRFESRHRALGLRDSRTLAAGVRYLLECQGDECRLVEAKTCGPSCECGPCARKREGRPFGGDARRAKKAGALLGASLGKAKRLLDSKTSDGTLTTAKGDVLDIPAGSLKSDIRRKRALRKVMGKSEADDKFPDQVDAWQTSEAVRAFHEAGVGDGMADSSPFSTPEITTDGDDRLQPDSREVNLRYSQGITRGVACGFCRYFQPSNPSDAAQGGGCAKVVGPIQFDNVCNLFEPRARQESARRAISEFMRSLDD